MAVQDVGGPAASRRQASRANSARIWRRALIISVGCVVLADFFAYAYKLYEGRSAFLRWQPQILELLDGTNIFRAYAYPNPPVMALALGPLAILPPKLGAALFYFIKVGLAGLTALWALRLARGASRPVPDWAIGLTLLMTLLTMIMGESEIEDAVKLTAVVLAAWLVDDMLGHGAQTIIVGAAAGAAVPVLMRIFVRILP